MIQYFLESVHDTFLSNYMKLAMSFVTSDDYSVLPCRYSVMIDFLYVCTTFNKKMTCRYTPHANKH